MRSAGCHAILPMLLAATWLSGCAATPGGPSTETPGDPAHPDRTAGWVETRLYFGLGPADGSPSGSGEAAWRDFLDHVVTPRFPDGLSVLDVQGQWQGPHETAPERLRSKLLVIDYLDDASNRAKIEAIRDAWKRRTGDHSVLRVTEPVDVSF